MNHEARSATSLLRVALIALVLIAAVLAFASRVRSQDEDSKVAVPAVASETTALGTAFNYSGQLDNGTANGDYDFQFKLFDAETGGAQVGATVESDNVRVTRGLFSTSIDFGPRFGNNPLFLEIGLRPGDQTSGYTVLAPRRPISPTPFALFSSTTNGLRVDANNHVRIGVDPAQKPYAQFASGQIWTSHPTEDAQLSMGFGPDGARIRVGGAAGAPLNQVFELQGPGDTTYMRSSAARTAFYGGLSLWPRDESNAAVHFSLTQSGTQLNLGGTGSYISGLEILRQNTRIARFDPSGLTVDNALTIRGGADLSERFDVSNGIEVEPGTVMVIDPNNAGHLTPSTASYDRKVAGVVSGAGDVDAGLVLSQEGVLEGDAVVAIAGRVYVRAEAISGPIIPGDLLTSSNLPGYAMAANDFERAQGAVIGKAMTGLESGMGLVLVLINLQ